MAYEVLARKWRPQQFDQVVGQGHVTGTLQRAIATSRVAHAYLFVGPRGVGKTSIARIMAKALNCQTNRDGIPCDTCSSCREIAAGNNLDVLEIDGASNNGVDNIRDLRDNVKFLPARGPFRVYIIDEVHMLSMGAFNALLKTLEEPPPHVKFLFATTEPQKVPATILSRCQRFDLRRISTGDIAGHLAKIATAEGITISDDAVYALARGAEGGLRDAESALDQVIAFRGKDIAEEDVLSVFGLVSRRQLDSLCTAVIDGDIPQLLTVIADLDAAGKDLQRLAAEVLDYFRQLVVMVYAPKVLSRQEVPEHQWKILQDQAQRMDAGRLSRVMEQLIAMQGQLRFALSRRVVLEMALIRAARAAQVATLDEVIAALKNEAGDDAGDDEPVPAQKKTAEPVTYDARSSRTTDDPPPRADAPAPTPTPAAAIGSPDELALLLNHWPQVCQKVGTMTPLAKAHVRDTKPIALGEVDCTIGLDAEFADRIPILKHPKCILALQHAIADVLGRKVSVHLTELAAPQEGQLPTDTPIPEPDPDAPPSETQVKRKWAEDPSVKNVMELFNGRISDIRQ
ncbi:MAG TPA: DNA polymerase III subunit gamma/tau [Kiritimatiellia bacterium]|nr:DNA polymerase III subunit gamma/tau [Kiritimatiellia bacterium]HMP35791.1 DNA polymerase III subunit gamma/tau [Kiritimatiellia bacterium]